MDEYFGWSTWQRIATDAFQVTNTMNRFRVVAKVVGGGVNAQAEAVRHGITRALIAFDPALKPALRRAGYVTRDARIKESKKYGLKRARRAPQYTKR
jgi:small subunit ribosomal protein S9